ncbi:AfsR/SARP family transcriptional regulator [Salininema proteolyticum]|uniref:BTAD domain-containing putative transcriptional regulator n=1 Tax=Salininema proteolyticum TaxID=1607685 RepID=A0ABV8TSN6_9ACTN
MAATLHVTVMNTFKATVEGRPAGLEGVQIVKATAYLALNAGRVVTQRKLLSVLWDGDPPDTAARQVGNILSSIRKTLRDAGFDGMVNRNRATLLTDVDTDAALFDRTLASARSARADGRTEQALADIDAALALVPPEPYPDLDGDVFDREATRLLRQAARAELERVELLAELEEWTATVAAGQAQLPAHPYSDILARALMTAHHHLGEPAEASRVYTEFRERLADRSGLDPAEETSALHTAILRDRLPRRTTRRAEAAVPRELPAAPHPFVGREKETAAIVEALEGTGGHLRVATVHGPGGMGKSALALAAGHRLADRFPDGQVYLNLHGHTPGHAPLTPTEALRRMLRSLGVDPGGTETEDETAARLRTVLGDRRVLLILDNTRDTAQVRPLLPGSAGAAAVITSRRPLALAGASTSIALGPLRDGDARDLVTHGLPATASDGSAADAIVASCEGMPLALTIAAARCRTRPDLSMAAFARRLSNERNRLSQLQIDDLAVRACLSTGYDDLRERGGDHALAARTFARLGSHPGADFDTRLLALLAESDYTTAERVAEILVEFQLVVPLDDGRFRMLDLIRLYAAETAGEGAETRRRLFAYYFAQLKLFTDPEVGTAMPPLAVPEEPYTPPDDLPARDGSAWRSWIRAEADNIERVALAVSEDEAGYDELFLEYSRTAYMALLRALADVNDTMALVRLGMESAERLPTSRQKYAATMMAAVAHTERAEFDRAEAFLASAAAMADELGDRRYRADCRVRLASVRYRRGDLETARRLADEAGAVAREEGHPRIRYLAGLYGSRISERLGETERAVREARRLVSFADGFDAELYRNDALDNLAFRLVRSGRAEEALEVFTDRQERLRESGDEATVNYAEVLWGTGEAYYATGNRGAARSHWNRAAEILFHRGHLTSEEREEVRAAVGRPPTPTAIALSS